MLNSDVDCDGDGILDEGCNLILGADTNVQLIPPSNANVLAASPVSSVQAFSSEKAFGLQFHVEQTNETVPQWSCVPEYKTALEETLGPNALDKFTSGVDDNLDTFNNSAKIIYHNFISII